MSELTNSSILASQPGKGFLFSGGPRISLMSRSVPVVVAGTTFSDGSISSMSSVSAVGGIFISGGGTISSMSVGSAVDNSTISSTSSSATTHCFSSESMRIEAASEVSAVPTTLLLIAPINRDIVDVGRLV